MKELIFQKNPAAISFKLISSPLNAVTLNDAARHRASILPEAAFYSFCYPVVDKCEMYDQLRELQTEDGKLDCFDPFVLLLATGAFIYYDFTFDSAHAALTEPMAGPRQPRYVLTFE